MMMLTESESQHKDLDKMSALELLTAINEEDHKVAPAIAITLPAIAALTAAVVEKIKHGGRLFYIGAGTSGRLGVVDASECPPTFGVTPDMVVALIAGGDQAMRLGIEGAEDSPTQGWLDLQSHYITAKDVVIGIAASGRTPYVLHALKECRAKAILTGCIVCNTESPIAAIVDYPVIIAVGAEILMGSTRMKAGTAQKLVLNMISTTLMTQLGRVKGNQMVHMQLSNQKLIERGTRMLMQQTQLDYETANAILIEQGSVAAAIEFYQKNKE
jgi:N-acetylmuramic acid 6-phosphate etherase